MRHGHQRGDCRRDAAAGPPGAATEGADACPFSSDQGLAAIIVIVAKLRSVLHPGQSEGLVHFTGRARASFAPEVVFMTPKERLESIISDRALVGHGVPGADQRVVCFSESNRSHAAALLRAAGFAGWGVVVSRQWAWDAGGGPVWYVRDDKWNVARSSLSPDLHSWLVRTKPNDSDWLHEHEWRVPCTSGDLVLEAAGVKGFIVSEADWEPPPRTEQILDPATGELVFGEVTPEWTVGIPVHFWNGDNLTNVGPVQRREVPWPL